MITRQFVKCLKCGDVAYYDYLVGGFGRPFMYLQCGHSPFDEVTVSITEEEARIQYAHLYERAMPPLPEPTA